MVRVNFISFFRFFWSGIRFTRISWLYIACSHGMACINGQPWRSFLAGFVSLWRDMPSDSLHLCLSLCDSSTLQSVWHTHIYTHSSLASLQTSIFLGFQHRANWATEILLIINDVNSLLWHLTYLSFPQVTLRLSHSLIWIKCVLW